MKRLFFFLLLQTTPLFSQTRLLSFATFRADNEPFPQIGMLSYEKEYYTADLQDQLSTTKDWSFQKPVSYLSLGTYNEVDLSRIRAFPGLITFSYLIPDRIIINDSVNEKLRGCSFKFPLTGFYFYYMDHSCAAFTCGLESGRLKLIDEQGRKEKNNLFGPFAAVFVKLKYGRFSLAASAQYCYDLTSRGWKKTWISDAQETSLPFFRQSGVTWTAGIGISL
ncbi:MAG TPA: hypothetical protein VL651_14900 [Bacteroidia bacterium]|jgi:hypothetical protein|nr:hypothetical protein [Bacteroidia bacterium]